MTRNVLSQIQIKLYFSYILHVCKITLAYEISYYNITKTTQKNNFVSLKEGLLMIFCKMRTVLSFYLPLFPWMLPLFMTLWKVRWAQSNRISRRNSYLIEVIKEVWSKRYLASEVQRQKSLLITMIVDVVCH